MSNIKENGQIFKAVKVLGVLAISLLMTYMAYAVSSDNWSGAKTANLVHNSETLEAEDEGVGPELGKAETEVQSQLEKLAESGKASDLAGVNDSLAQGDGDGNGNGDGDGENNKLSQSEQAGAANMAAATIVAASQEKREPVPVNAVASRESAPAERSAGEVAGEGRSERANGPTNLPAESQPPQPLPHQPPPEVQPQPQAQAETQSTNNSPAETSPAASLPAQQQGSAAEQYLNQYVLDVIKTYPIAPGRFPYLLNNDYANYNGVTETLRYQNKELLRAHPSGNRASHCVGITFEVFFKAMQERNRQLGISPDNFNGMSHSQLFDFALHWFAAGPKQTHNIVTAVEKYGLGQRISRLEDARPGDFLDFDRENGTGHTVVFLEWIKEGEKIIGLKYWSSQQSTGGINYNEEYFNLGGQNSAKYGNVMINSVRIAGIVPVNEYKSFR